MQDTRGAESTGADSPPRLSRPSNSWFAAPAAAILVVVCCAGPLFLGALVASGAGGWLATHGFLLGGAAVMVAAAVLSGIAWIRFRRG